MIELDQEGSRSDRDGQWQLLSPEHRCTKVQSGQMCGQGFVTEAAQVTAMIRGSVASKEREGSGSGQ